MRTYFFNKFLVPGAEVSLSGYSGSHKSPHQNSTLWGLKFNVGTRQFSAATYVQSFDMDRAF